MPPGRRMREDGLSGQEYLVMTIWSSLSGLDSRVRTIWSGLSGLDYLVSTIWSGLWSQLFWSGLSGLVSLVSTIWSGLSGLVSRVWSLWFGLWYGLGLRTKEICCGSLWCLLCVQLSFTPGPASWTSSSWTTRFFLLLSLNSNQSAAKKKFCYSFCLQSSR